MYKMGKNKVLAKLITASFAVNSVGGMIVPMTSVMAADKEANVPQSTSSTSSQGTDTKKSEADKKKEQKAAALKSAQDYESSVKQAASSVVSLSDDDDDLVFLNKIILLCTDKTGKTKTADNYANLVASAQATHDKAEAAGQQADNLTNKILWADERVHNILDKLQSAGTIDTSVPTATMIDSAKADYQKGIAAVKTCKAQAAVDGKDASACTLSPDAQAAANLLMTRGLRQMNISSTTGKTTNVADTKGTSKVGNKSVKWVKDPKTGKYYEETTDNHWVKDPKTGLYHEETTTNKTEISCGADEVFSEEKGACIAKAVNPAPTPATCKDGETMNEKGVCVKTTITCKADEVLNEKGDTCITKPTPTPAPTTCSDGETLNEKGVCVKSTITCKTDEVLNEKGDTCVKKETPKITCKDDETLNEKGDTCIKKPVTCAEGTVLDEKGVACVKKDDPKAAEVKKSDGGDNGKLISALGTIGAIAGLLSSGGGSGVTLPEKEDSLQYAFNYMSKTKEAPQIHLLPSNSDSIKFKLFQYNIPKDANGKAVTPQAVAFVQIPMQKQGGAPVLKEVRIPLTINQMVTLFPDTISDSDKVYLPLKEFGSIARISASNFQGTKKDASGKSVANGKALPYYTMKVVVDDGVSGHSRNFLVHYDFIDAKTVIGNPDKELKRGTNTVMADALNLDFTGKIAGATWDNEQQSCIIDLEGETMDNDSHEKYSGTNQINSQRYNQAGCEKVGQMKGHDISINGLTKSNDGKGNEILVDDKSTGAQISIEGSTLRLADISDAYKDDVAFEKQNVDIIVKRTDGTDQVFKSGYKTDGVYLYDTNGHKLTLSQEIDEAQIVNGLTGQNYHRIGACDATSDSKLIGQVCAFELDANGNEVQKDRISGQNFTREDLTVSGNVNNADMRKANEAKEANSTGWADVDRNTITSKVVDTVKGQARVLDQALDVPKPVSITGISENRLFGGYRDYETLPPMTVANADGTTSEIKTSRDLENAINRLYSKGESVTVNIGGKAMTLNKKDPKYAEDIQMVNDYYNEMKIRANDKTEHDNSNVAGSVTGTLTKAGAGVPASATSDKSTVQVMGNSGATYVGKQDSTEQADKPANEGQSADVEYVEATGTGDSNRAATTNAQINLAKKAGVEHVKAEVVDKGKNQDGSYFVTMRMAVPKK